MLLDSSIGFLLKANQSGTLRNLIRYQDDPIPRRRVISELSQQVIAQTRRNGPWAGPRVFGGESCRYVSPSIWGVLSASSPVLQGSLENADGRFLASAE